jgi:peroxiredoxin
VSKIIPGATLAVVLLLFSACSTKSTQVTAAQSETAKSKDRKMAPDFNLTDANGATAKLSDYRGKVVLLNFWATWCGPCKIEIPWFEEFEQQYKSKGFEVVGISMDEEGWPVIKPFLAAQKVNYRVLLGNDSVSQLYGGVDSLPTTFIIDRDGKFAFSPHVGLAGKNEYLSEIQALLGTKQSNGTSARNWRSVPAAIFARPAE